jgi:hypothetical protein
MTIADIYDRILIELGMHQLESSDVESYIMSTTNFIKLVKSTLGPINGSMPKTETRNISINNSYFTFVSDIPERVINIVPIKMLGVHANHLLNYVFSLQRTHFGLHDYKMGKYTSEMEKQELPAAYKKPDLYVPIDGDYDVMTVTYYAVTQITGSSPATYEVVGIDDNFDEFFDLLKAKFMQAVGRSRRAFMLNEMPVTMDAETMVEEGKTLEEEVTIIIEEVNSKLYIAFGGVDNFEVNS